MVPTFLRHSTQRAPERIRDYIEFVAADSNTVPLGNLRAVLDPHTGTAEWSDTQFIRMIQMLGFAMCYFGGKPFVVLDSEALLRPTLMYNQHAA